MRLSKILTNINYKDDLELMFFHGTSTKWKDSFISNGVRIRKLNKKRDFGQGFYLTTNYWQAKQYANTIAYHTSTPEKPAEPLVIACTILLGCLRENLEKGLIIDEFDEKWVKTIIRGRFHSETNPLSNDYDWIYGRCGDGPTTTFQKVYYKNSNTDIRKLLKIATPRRDHPHFEYDQLWLGTNDAINYIQSIEFINKEGVNYESIPLHHQS